MAIDSKQDIVSYMKIFLIRHAEGEDTQNTWQTPQTPLSIKGVKQAEGLSKLPRFKIVDALISSDWTRSLQTAKIVGKVINKPVRSLEEVHEKEQSTKIYGISRKNPLAVKYMQDLIKHRHDWAYKWDQEEESWEDLVVRVVKFKNYLIENYSQKSVAVFSHDMFLRMLITVCTLGDGSGASQFRILFNSINIDNTGVSLLIYREEILVKYRFIIGTHDK